MLHDSSLRETRDEGREIQQRVLIRESEFSMFLYK